MISNLNKVVLVTGASSGIGAAVALKFAETGAKVTITGRNEEKLKSVSEKCEKNGSKPFVIAADVSKDEDVERLVSNTVNHFGRIDVLVNNAGMAGVASSITRKDAMKTHDLVFATNFRSAVYITNLLVPYLIKHKGNIINISSVEALIPNAINFPYATSKAALDHFTRCIASELGPHGVRANCINPGPVRTDILQNMGPKIAAQEEKIFKGMKKATVLNRIADPEEIADLVLFLASDKARSITGASFIADNGVLLKGAQK